MDMCNIFCFVCYGPGKVLKNNLREIQKNVLQPQKS